MMRGAVISSPIHPKERHMLRRLDQCDGEYLAMHGLADKLACAALVHAGYAKRHGVFAHHYRITPQGEAYLDRLARAH